MSHAEVGERTWIDEWADRFESDWVRGGARPRIEDFLEGETGPRRGALLQELLRVERELRLGAGEQPGAEEYLHRFPDDPDAVAAVFGHEDRPEACPARAPVSAAHGLLFGLLALQNNFIDRDALLSAFGAWVADKSQSLSQILLERGSLSPGRHAAIEILVQEHLQQHGHDPERSLAVLKVVPDVRNKLEVVPDLDLQASLLYVGLAETSDGGADPDETTDGWDDSSTADPEGRFQLLRLHDRGGLGEVYVARDQQLHRIVALKRIKKAHGTDREKRARFLVEAEITGRLEHPGIVPVYGLGTFDDGRPFYAMRFIRGDNLKSAIAQFHADESANRDPGRRTLALHKLLRRFLDVCNAIDYAHSRGVLHRDLKPGNIMLGKFGETLVVDWGLAKTVGRPEAAPAQGTLDDRTLVPQSGSDLRGTELGARLGTPAFMSPEQAAGKTDALGPASDVYSLGATLYCLLTGRAPFDGADIVELLHKVERGDFPPPRQLKPWIHPALEAICLKAMATDPARRYESPRKLTDDIEHWLADEPVSAWRDPLAERVGRWMRRRRTLVTAAAATLVAATVGLAAVLVVQARANGALNKANNLLAESVRREQKANADLGAAASQIQARFDLALEAIKTFHTGVSEDVLLKNDNLQPVRDRLLKGAAEFYKRLGDKLSGQSDRGSRRALGQAYFEMATLASRLGATEQGIANHRQALAVRRALAEGAEADDQVKAEVGRSLHHLGALLMESGRTDEARNSLEAARTLLEDLTGASPADTWFQRELALSHIDIGNLLRDTGKLAEAMASLDSARVISQKLANAHPAVTQFQRDLAISHNNIGNLLLQAGKPKEALASYQAALAIQQRLADANPAVTEYQRLLALSHRNIANLLSQTGKAAAALESYQAARAIQQRLADASPAVIQFQSDQAQTHSDIGYLLSQTGKPREALVSYQAALAIQQKLADANPAVIQFQPDLVYTRARIGLLLSQTGKPGEGLASLQAALAIQQRLADTNPALTRFQSNLADIHGTIYMLLFQTGKAAEALASSKAARAILQRLADASPADTGLQGRLARSHNDVGGLLRATGKPIEAMALHRAALAIEQRLADANPADTGLQADLALSHQHIGGLLKDAGRSAEALPSLQAARAVEQRLADANPTVTKFQRDLANSQISIGILLRETGKPAEALAPLQAARAILRKQADADPNSADFQVGLANTELETGEALRLTGKPAEARACYERALAILARLIDAQPALADGLQIYLTFGWKGLGATQQAAGQPAAAVASWRRAVATDERARSARGETLYILAGCHARLGGIAAAAGSGLPASEGAVELDRAMTLLRRAAEGGFHPVAWMNRDPDLDPLRGRPDFQAMMADLAFPAQPFSIDREEDR
jgi:serine/threonine-protein kinase